MAKHDTDSSRARLLATGKKLFAQEGYENTVTSTLARDAGTSESQLVRHFGGKSGLLETIFEESWRPLIASVRDLLADARDGRSAVTGVLLTALAALEADDALATIFLFEGRRIRGDQSRQIKLSSGFIEFSDVVCRLIRRGQKDGSFASGFEPTALAAALIGAVEGMLRERMLVRRNGASRSFSDKQLRRVFDAMLDAFASPAVTRASRRR
jgi:TetR/AcrR family fatty acid metabolism transcriptional regulator